MPTTPGNRVQERPHDRDEPRRHHRPSRAESCQVVLRAFDRRPACTVETGAGRTAAAETPTSTSGSDGCTVARAAGEHKNPALNSSESPGNEESGQQACRREHDGDHTHGAERLDQPAGIPHAPAAAKALAGTWTMVASTGMGAMNGLLGAVCTSGPVAQAAGTARRLVADRNARYTFLRNIVSCAATP